MLVAVLLLGNASGVAELASWSSPGTIEAPASLMNSVGYDGSIENHVAYRPTDELDLSQLLLPKRDVVDLARRFRSSPEVQIPATEKQISINQSRQFWITDGNAKSRVITARLVDSTSHVDAYVQDGETVDLTKLRASLSTIETHLLPTLLRDFTASKIPMEGLRIAVLNLRLSSVAGYYSSVNEHPSWVFPSSNQLPLIGMNIRAVAPGSNAYASTLSHELAHFLQWRLDPADDTWVNEGTAEVAIRASGYAPSRNVESFASRPNTSLIHWTDNISQTPAHYGAADLFFSYIANRFGGFATIGEILARSERGVSGVERVLRDHGVLARPSAFDSVFLDWVVANWANIPGDPRWGYKERADFNVTDQSLSSMSLPASLEVSPYGARYIELAPGDGGRQLVISTQAAIPAIAAPERPGPIWWSGRGDNADSRLTRELDLRAAEKASLKFSTWFDLESDFDYAYIAVSVDDGLTWKSLPGGLSTAEDPNGVNLGNGFTGQLDNPRKWSNETVDLTPYAGIKIKLRFEVVNDDAYVGDGFAIDNISVPEIGWADRVGDSGWSAEGFVRIQNSVVSQLSPRLAMISGSVLSLVPFTEYSRGVFKLTVPLGVNSADRAAIILANHTAATSRPLTVQIRTDAS